jgi:5,6,7,8-tetrahydromethanopterin hydro-lyase
MHSPVMEIGESFVGSGADAAHVNTVLGRRDGPVGTAWATALATPSTGHAPFVCVLAPGVPTQPATLFVNKAAIAGDRHAALTWGAAQAGVAAGVRDYVADHQPAVDQLVLICAVWVDPDAADEELVFANNAAATQAALELGAGFRHAPTTDGMEPVNPFFRTGRTG